LIRFMMKCIALMLLMTLLLAAWLSYFAVTPIQLQQERQEVSIKPSSIRGVCKQLLAQGVLSETLSFEALIRVLGRAPSIKAGTYSINSGLSAYDLINKLSSGDTTQTSITFIEGWTFAEMRAALDAHEEIRHMTMAYSDEQILAEIGAKETQPEGLFFPDTYFFSRFSSDKEILQNAYQNMQRKLNAAWANRVQGLPYATPYQALIMASIVEKETGRASERPLIAGVFINRLKLGMRLQTDPTVIYGLGMAFDGNLRKKDLLQDSAYNTYTRAGLPPTPIAMPSLAAIEAALNPAKTNAIYFVGKGDGSHAFSATLAEHNRAVYRYQLHKN
jgi:UPF0755 protein